MAGKGTDADLINISGTAQGDIYYNNGSALRDLLQVRNQVLQTGMALVQILVFGRNWWSVLQVKETIYFGIYIGINNASMGIINSNFKV